MNANLKLSYLKGDGQPCEYAPGKAVTIGRTADSVIHLNDQHVSRRHATLNCIEGNWTLVDNGSRHGTLINGTLLAAQEPCVLAHGDQVGIKPYVLRVDLGGESMTLLHLSPEGSAVNVQLIEQDELQNLAGKRLRVLLDVAAKLQDASDEKSLAQTAAVALIQGTGFARALVLRSQDGAVFEVLASEALQSHRDAQARVSRTLLRAAASGKAVRLEDAQEMNMSESILTEGVTAALCIPIFLGVNIEGFIYLDSTSGVTPGNDAAAFAVALGQFIGMGLGEIRRRDLAQRQMHIQRELSAAHDVQRRLMPAETGAIGSWRWTFNCEPGRVVAGDIIGAGEGADGFWFFLGDVAGKGMSAGMLMASIQAYLAAELERGGSVVDSMNAVNSYVRRHRSASEFATLMALRLSNDGRVLRMVDAGHAMGAIVRAGAAATLIDCNGGPPIGVLDDAYECSEFELQPSDRIVLFSDGVSEQRNADGEELGIERVLDSLANSKDEGDDVERVMNLLRAHAAGAPFTDDVSVASLRFVSAEKPPKI